MLVTLLEALKTALNRGETKRAGVIATFARTSQWLADLPFKDIQGNSYAYDVEAALPGMAFRGIGESYTPGAGVVNPASEALRIAGGYLDIDRATVKMAGPQARSSQESLQAKSLASTIANNLIKGDSSSNPRQFDGLQRRLTGAQLTTAGTTDAGDALSLAIFDAFLETVSGPNKQLWMNKVMARRLTTAARTSTVGGFMLWEVNAFGQQIASYNGIPIRFQYPDNDGTESLAFDEAGDVKGTPAGSSSASIYCVSLGDGYVSGIQNGVMDVIDQGLLDSPPVYRTLVEWLCSMVIEHPKAAARLGGISNAAVVA
jgi:hypothetical protein